MNLLYLADIRFPMERANGIQTVETCHGLARAGVGVELVVRRSDDRSDKESLDFYGLPEHPHLKLRRFRVPFPGKLAGRLVFAARSLLLAARTAADVLYTRDLVLADLAVRSRRWHRLPIVYEAHTSAVAFAEEAPRLYRGTGSPSRRKIDRLRRREKRVYRKADRLVAITRELERFLEKAYGDVAPVTVIPDGTRVPQTIPPLRAPAPGESFRVTYIGHLYPWKGVDTIIEAMKDLPGEELVIVGGLPPEPDLDRARELARALGVAERVSFRGYLPPTALTDERLRADAFVIPLPDSLTARYFTSPLKLFEAMAAGRPIVASDLPSIREVLTNEVDALLVPPGDPHAFAAAIRRLAGDRELGARLARRAGEHVRRFSWDERGKRIASLLREMVAMS